MLLALVAAMAVAEGILTPGLTNPVLSVAAVLVVAPTVLWRRTHPLWMLVIVLVPVDIVLPISNLTSSLFLLVLVYALFRWGSGRDIVVGFVLLVGILGLTFFRGGGLVELIGGFALLLSALLLGMAFRYRAAARQRQTDRIRMLEREHLARDLHDTVAHHVTAIAIRAQAGLAVAGTDPTAAENALGVIEAEAAQTLRELRSMVHVLRLGESADLAPSPGLDAIAQLAGVRPGGVVVDVTVTESGFIVPPPVAGAVFRLAQESVTNALRHARHATWVDVHVTADDGGVRLRVVNDGDLATPTAPGFGLIGMTERAALLGGTCTSGPAPDGGWVVTADLPREGWAP